MKPTKVHLEHTYEMERFMMSLHNTIGGLRCTPTLSVGVVVALCVRHEGSEWQKSLH